MNHGAAVAEEVRIGVLAKRGAERALEKWGPTADYLTRMVPGYTFSIIPLDFHEVTLAAESGEVDFLLANSAIYVELESGYGVSRIVTLRNRGPGGAVYTRFGGVVFTRADRPDITGFGDLEGKRFAAVEATSLGGFLAAWREFHRIGLDPYEDFEALRFVGTHDAVVRAVLAGEADAGTVRSDTLERMAAEGEIRPDAFRIIEPRSYSDFGFAVSTRLYPEWPLAKLAHTPEVLADRVAAALLDMEPDAPAAEASQSAGWTVPLNYQPVRRLMQELEIGPYAELGRITPRRLLQEYGPWLAAVLFALLLLAASTAYVSALNRRLRATDRDLREARDTLAERVQERTAELERTLHDLEDSKHRLELVYRDWNDAFDAIQDPIFIHDRELRIVHANPAYIRRTGLPAEELTGRLYWEVFPILDAPLGECTHFPEHAGAEPEEITLNDGEVFLSRSFGIKGPDGVFRHAIHILEDVTSERRAERRRRTLSRAVEQAQEAVAILSADRRLVFVNRAFAHLLGEKEAVPGRPVEEIIHADDDTLSTVWKSMDEGGGWSGEMELILPSGNRLPAFLSVSRIADEKGVGSGYVVTVLDLSKVVEAERALQYRLGFESVIGSIAARFLAQDDIPIGREVEHALSRIGEFVGADRSYLFELDVERDTVSNTYEWCREGIAAKRDELQDIPVTDYPWLADRVRSGLPVHIPDVRDLPEEAAPERELLLGQDIQSALIMPIVRGGEAIGFIGFDMVRTKHSWAPEDIRMLGTAGEIVSSALARHAAEEAVRHSEASLAEAQRIARLGNWDWDIVTNRLAWSDEIYRIFGVQPQEFGASYDAFLSYIHPDDRDKVIAAVNRAVQEKAPYSIDHRVVLPDGEERVVHEHGRVTCDSQGRAVRMFGTVQDVTEARRAESELRRLNRALWALSRGNTVLIHATDETELLQDVCRVLAEMGGYRLAWVGYPQKDKGRTVRPVAHAGKEDGYLDAIRVSWGDDAEGRGPTGTAIRTGKTVIVRNIATDPHFKPWRGEALRRGYASVIALPLVADGETFGALTIDADEPEAFDPREVELLQELAGDLAFGIAALRGRAERSLTRAALEESERRYRDLYTTAPTGYASVRIEDARIAQSNPAFAALLGYRQEDLIGRSIFDIYDTGPEGLDAARRVFERLKSGAGTKDMEVRMKRADGTPLWVSLSVEPVTDKDGNVVESRSSVIDISERKAAEEERQQFAARLERSLLQTIEAISLTIEKRDPYTAGHQQRVSELAVAIAGRMGLSQERTEALRLAAMIHDTGKIYVPTEILNRPGKLDAPQYTLLKAHPQVGYDIIKGIDFPWPLADIVVQHHERLDGSGYPKGLKDGEIRLESRILAVADVVEAIASHRPYRPAHTVDTALKEIEAHKGDLFDPEVVDVCAKLFREEGFTWKRKAGVVEAHETRAGS